MNSQLHWALPPGKKSPAMVCLITIRKNKQSESTAESSTSHLNRTKSSRSNKVGLMPNMIPCFPASNGTDAHHCDTISNRSSPSHFTKDSPSNISQVRARPTTNNLCHCLENQKGYYLRMTNQFLELVYLRK